MERQAKRVYLGLSGGVDSSVSAALLKRGGYEVTGVFIKVWQPDFFECGWKDDRLDTMRVCARIGIPFRELNLEKAYKREVVDYMIREYKAGRTPNPDVMCNRFIKFGMFYESARREGADFVATGHYARITKAQSTVHKNQTKHSAQKHKLLTTHYSLLTGLDPAKDQSYFLWQLRSAQLSHILFPVGGMRKAEVRKLAREFNLVTADKKDSQGLCFIGKVDMKEFLSHYIKEKSGNILDNKGRIIGKHNGAFFYTIGQRVPVELGKAYFVVGKDMRKNIITVSERSSSGQLGEGITEVVIKDYNWVSGAPATGKLYLARVRYRQSLQECRIMKYELGTKKRPGITHTSELIIRFASSQTVAPGQSLVIYDGDVLLGGGIIC